MRLAMTLVVLVVVSCGDNIKPSATVDATSSSATCGDLTCDPSESCSTCETDCGVCGSCGNGTCELLLGESCQSCSADCGACAGCGNGICQPLMGETCASCPADCQVCPTECADMIDNDNDGKIDFHPLPGMGDPQCTSPADNSEAT